MGGASLNRIARAALVASLVGALGASGAVAPVLAAARVPKVVLVVGPAGSLTASFRAQAEQAAAVAEAAGAQTVRVYSPNATWPAVQQATAGASIVVYLGHGNGWPSRYRDDPYPATQNGFGLNPVAGGDDSAHQYFGEASVESLQLAPNAVVLLHHLCYASGNTEPGLPEGTQAESIQRVDNYAAGFLRAGARAVVAEGHLGPAYYMRALLQSRLTIEQIWQRSPASRGNTFAIASVRSPGYTARLDPDKASGGYYRSLVSAGLSAAAVRASASGALGGVPPGFPVQPTLANLGLRFGDLSLRALPIADSTTSLSLPLSKAGLAAIPSGAQVGVRWDPILLDPAPVAPGGDPAPSPSPDASPAPGPSPSAQPSAAPSPAPSPGASPDPSIVAPAVELVVPEQLGAVVTLARVKTTATGLTLAVRYPTAPGLYRLVPTLHTPSGVAYDAATQALLTPVLVRIGGPIAVAFGVAPSRTLEAGSPATLAVRVANVGTVAWDEAGTVPPRLPDELLVWLRTSRMPARLVATWVSAAGLRVPDPVGVALDPAVSAPGGDASIGLELVAPADPGEYLLLLDVMSPSHGPLSALGNAPGLVRVTVLPGAAASPDPGLTPPESRH